jgi:hypothetical protein
MQDVQNIEMQNQCLGDSNRCDWQNDCFSISTCLTIFQVFLLYPMWPYLKDEHIHMCFLRINNLRNVKIVHKQSHNDQCHYYTQYFVVFFLFWPINNQSKIMDEYHSTWRKGIAMDFFWVTVVREKRIILIIKNCSNADNLPVKRALHTKKEDSHAWGQCIQMLSRVLFFFIEQRIKCLRILKTSFEMHSTISKYIELNAYFLF